jgi:hypothetical protein
MADNTPARPWAVWLSGELHGDFPTAESQAKIAHGIWFSGQQQTENQMEAEAS